LTDTLKICLENVMSSEKYVAWWSAGVTSAVATKLALDAFGRAVEVLQK